MDAINKDLSLDDGTTLRYLKKDKKYFLNQSTLLYGQTNSGKSVLIDEIMYLCKDFIPNVFVICKTVVTTTSSPYYRKIPSNCIKSDVTVEWLTEFMETQKGRAALYLTANDMTILGQVFDKIKTPTDDMNKNSILQLSNSRIQNIMRNNTLDFGQKSSQKTEIEDICNEYLKKLYKDCIRKNKIRLESFTNLTMGEICCIKNLDFNPNILLILDDCATHLKKWVKASPTLKDIFYYGRHIFVTLIIAAQDDKELDSELRKNAIISVFTTSQASNANFDRSSNSYSKDIKKRAVVCSNKVFNSSEKARNHKKLVYHSKSDNDNFYYTIANIYPPFRMGCQSIWDLDDNINKLNSEITNDSAFFKIYYNQ